MAGQPCTASRDADHEKDRLLADLGEQQAALQQRLAVEATVSRISSRFVGSANLDDAINASLADLGQLARASRAYLIQLREDETATDNTHEWCAEGVRPEKDRLQGIPAAATPWAHERFRAGEVINIPDVSQMPPEAQAERELLESQDIKSVLAFPLSIRGEYAGFVGLDNCQGAGEWRAEDIAILRVCSDIFGRALERQRVEAEREHLLEQLRQTNEQLAQATARAKEQAEAAQTRAEHLGAILNAINDGLIVFGPQAEIAHVNQQALRILGVTPEQWQGLTLAERMETLRMQTPEGQAIPPAETPLARARRGETITGYRLTVRRPDGRLVHLLASASPIRDAQGSIQGVIATLTDVSELQHLQEEREEFVRTISHDLRNPLTPLLGMAELLERKLKQKGLEAEANSAALIARSAQRLNTMIRDLVDSIRLETGKLELRKEPVDLFLFLSDLLSRLGTERDRARLHLEAPARVPPVEAAVEQIERAVANLVSNAFKYSPPETPVCICLECVGKEAVISVCDQGMGIPSELIPQLFERYYRARSDLPADGLGLGLYIARLIVEAHGGRLWAESEVGKGSTFRIALPLAETTRADA